MKALIENLKLFSQFSDAEFESLTPFFRKEVVLKNEYILQGGEVSKRIYFVKKGCLKVYFIAGNKENVLDFFMENDWFVELNSFINKTPSPYFIQAIESCEVYSISKINFEKQRKNNLNWERFYSRLLETQVPRLIEMLNDKLSLSNEDAYFKMMQLKPQLIHRVPQYLIASYLGLTPEGLSKLRKRTIKRVR